MTDREAAEMFAEIARQRSIGQLASGAGRSKETAKQWRAARQAPSLASAISLGRVDPGINARLKRALDGIPEPECPPGQGDLFEGTQT
jgi:hypothetical protein